LEHREKLDFNQENSLAFLSIRRTVTVIQPQKPDGVRFRRDCVDAGAEYVGAGGIKQEPNSNIAKQMLH
jgi:hypothetical protein